MADYLTTKNGRWAFQMRVPGDLVNYFGTTPIRILLPHLSRVEARRYANVIAGAAEHRFAAARSVMNSAKAPHIDIEDMPEEVGELFSKSELVKFLNIAKGCLASERGLRLIQIQRMEMEHAFELATWSQKERANFQRLEHVTGLYAELLNDVMARYKKVLEGLSESRDPVLVAEMRAMGEVLKSLHAPKQTHSYPRLSDVKDAFIEHKKLELNPKGEFNRYTHYAVPGAISAWLIIIGDKPLDHYRSGDLSLFGSTLARVPSNWQKIRALRGKTLKEAADYNTKLERPFPTLVQTSILRGYLIPVRECLNWLCEQQRDHPLTSPFSAVKAKSPRNARQAEDRDSLTVDQVSKLFGASCKRGNKVERWMPLLAFLTGCRLGELIRIQGKDFKRYGNVWGLDLREEVLHTGEKRRIKNAHSRRLVACHRFLEECGFIEWARKRPGFVFDTFIKGAKNPEDAASKRLNRLLRDAGVESENVTFHSLRHSTKDWLRGNAIEERTIDLQCGHKPKSVAQRYGKKSLRQEDLPTFWDVPLPASLNISGYQKQS